MLDSIQELNIKSYRGIENLHINNLGAVNILVGDNNVGKTSVLEAIQLLGAPTEKRIYDISKQRENYNFIRIGLNDLDAVAFMFNINNKHTIEISGVINGVTGNVIIKGEKAVRTVNYDSLRKAEREYYKVVLRGKTEIESWVGEIINTFDNNSVPYEINNLSRIMKNSNDNVLILTSMVKTIDFAKDNPFDELIKNKSIKKKTVELLKYFDENIIDIRYISDGGMFVPVVDVSEDEYLPLSLYGDGMQKVLTIINAVIKAENGVALIDEFETALHTSVMSKVFRFMIDVAKEMNVQLFLTTHSIEAVDKLLESASDDIGSVRVIRVRKGKEKIFAKVLDGIKALEFRNNYDMELRV